jgi:glc operon protein GlcG
MQCKSMLLCLCLLCVITSRSQDLKPTLNLSTAEKIIRGCLAFADSGKLVMAIAVYDANAQLIAFAKMDGASVGTAKVAQWKGLSAATYQYSTEQTGKWNVPNAPDISGITGGLPVYTKDGAILGGVGVSGAAASVDARCAEAGVKNAGMWVRKE